MGEADGEDGDWSLACGRKSTPIQLELYQLLWY